MKIINELTLYEKKPSSEASTFSWSRPQQTPAAQQQHRINDNNCHTVTC